MIEVQVRGANETGDHVTGTVALSCRGERPQPASRCGGWVVGIGATEFSKESGRSELRLAVEACDAAIADAGLEPAQIDGMVTYTQDTNPEIEIARNLGVG